jgi:hypothetical protein
MNRPSWDETGRKLEKLQYTHEAGVGDENLLGEWTENKFSFVHQGMGDFQPGVIDDFVSVEQDI